MTAYRLAAFRAFPLLLLRFQKPVYTMIPNIFQVFYHAHMIFFLISLIKRFQIFAREAIALIAEPYFSLSYQITMILQAVRAVLTSRDTARAIFSVYPLLLQIIFHRLITDTQTAIHTAGCDQRILVPFF